MTEHVLYEVKVPPEELTRAAEDYDDTPASYRVVCDDDPERPACIVYGRYDRYRTAPEWMANCGTRWLVRHLLRENAALREALETLVDEQNVPPLIRDAPRWRKAMATSCKLLGRTEAVAFYESE